ncbi:class I SAM-dependent methyltransferase [Leptospira adleri]|uniref:class I SAM-dependent methyltransferase n=1 Tax=Leptospira adleri TaxID=2023186 RepID=UPI0010833AA2|nr:class I SAM-dependent methyltransferase [Leptospira adleri]TGM58880.1 class I SAM-dependent methyltransferase [Leptospira adleri]
MENNVFNQIANGYDTKERKELARIIVGAIKAELKESKDKSLLDYGCGTGLVGLELAPLVHKIILMDSAEKMLEIVREKVARADIKNAKVIRSDFMEEGSGVRADVIVASLVLLHVSDPEILFKNFYSSLNTNGKLIVVDFDKNENVSHPKVHNGFVQEDLRSKLSGAGFTETKTRTFHHGKNIFMNQDASLLISVSTK